MLVTANAKNCTHNRMIAFSKPLFHHRHYSYLRAFQQQSSQLRTREAATRSTGNAMLWDVSHGFCDQKKGNTQSRKDRSSEQSTKRRTSDVHLSLQLQWSVTDCNGHDYAQPSWRGILESEKKEKPITLLSAEGKTSINRCPGFSPALVIRH